jgi:hypothetical protein
MDDFNQFEFEEWIDEGCPVCGAEDCASNCIGVPAPPQMYAMIEQQMAYVSHRVAQNVMKRFKDQMLVEKAQELSENWTDFIRLAKSLYNAEVLINPEEVIGFFENPVKFKRQYMLWLELGKPINSKSETWTMFMEAIRNTNGQQTENTGN